MKIPNSLIENLRKIENNNKLRTLDNFNQLIDFQSNDYLSLAQNPKNNYILQGSTGSRLISGNSIFHEKLEEWSANFFKAEASLFFNSGYAANLGVLSSIPTRFDTILYDEKVHASIKDGIRLSLAKNFPFKHNDFENLEKKILQSAGNKYIVVESVYSMDGDSPDWDKLVALSLRDDVYLIVDEAHSIGIFGENGEGICVDKGIEEHFLLRIYPLGKAPGATGAIVVGQNPIIQYLINSARSFIYSTALPPQIAEFCLQNLIQMQNANNQRLQLAENLAFASNILNQKLVSPIIPILIGGNDNTKLVANKLKDNNFGVKAILSPTVPIGFERLRIVLHAHNSKTEIENLFNKIEEIKNIGF